MATSFDSHANPVGNTAPKVAAWRDPHSSMPEIVGAAREELDAGNYENAWTAYTIALEHWLRVRWIQKSGKVNTPIVDRYQLLDRLKASLSLDDWANKAIRLVLTRPLPVERWHVEIVAAVVAPLTVDEVESGPRLPVEALMKNRA